MATVTASDVLLFYPNLIGYARILCMFLSFYFAKLSWKTSMSFYLTAFVGDVIDGYVARMFGQSSSYGGVLDMVTDRVSTCGLLIILSNLYPDHTFKFLLLISIDIFSHWFHVMSLSGHHKSKDSLKNRNALLQWYYSIYPLFGYCCVGTEFFYILLYVLHFRKDSNLELICWYFCFPACILKQVVNVIQLSSAAYAIADMDVETHNHKE